MWIGITISDALVIYQVSKIHCKERLNKMVSGLHALNEMTKELTDMMDNATDFYLMAAKNRDVDAAHDANIQIETLNKVLEAEHKLFMRYLDMD